MRIQITSIPQIEFAEDCDTTDHCTFHFINEDGAIGMAIISGYFGQEHPMPVAPGKYTDLQGVWTDHNTFHSEYLENPDLPSETGHNHRDRQANAVLNQTQAAAETVLALLSDQDTSAKTTEELKSLASNLLVIAEFAHPAGCSFLKHERYNWLWHLWDTAAVVDHEYERTLMPL